MRSTAEPTLDRLVELVARGADPEGALARIQAGMLARAAGAKDLEHARGLLAKNSHEAAALLEPLAMLEVAVLPALGDTDALSRFYELLQARLQPAQRRALGQYFTPRPLVRAMWSLALDAIRAVGLDVRRTRVVDPAAGSGAFLVEGLTRGLAGAQLLGVEILGSAARTATVNACLAAQGKASPRVLEADAYAPSTFDALLAHARGSDSLLVIGNPPYNGSSPLLKDAARLASARERLLPFARYHSPHSGFRDDFAYFFGLAHALFAESDKPGAIVLITPSSLLDARDYLGLRRFLLERYALQIVDVGPAAFPDARVDTCISVLTRGGHGARYFSLSADRDAALASIAEQPSLAALGPALAPAHPDYALRPVPAIDALENDVDAITDVLQRWFTPHKTGFDELLVDADPERIWERLVALRSKGFSPRTFAERFGEDFAAARVQKKLEAAHAWAVAQPEFPERGRVMPYLRYNPRQARFAAPREQWQHVYFEPRIATLFNHAFKGTIGQFKPHAQKPQLIFNTFESPLYAMVVEKRGVLHLYQHARFAPLHVPENVWRARDEKVERPDAGKPMLNLTSTWQERAALLREPSDVFHLLAGIMQSALVQRLFAPNFGKRRALPVKRLTSELAPLAQRIADRARMLAALESRGGNTSELQTRLDDDVVRLYLGADLPASELARSSLYAAVKA